MISIIVPAHNEAGVIERGLRAMVAGAAPGELEVVVACNGCTDRTAEFAAAVGPPVRVIHVTTASKTAALNAGDAAASGFPRFYVDADVVLSLASIRKIAAVLQQGEIHFATPALLMDLSRTTWAVRAFYRVWTALPYNSECGAIGTGVYALSREGRSRFGAFPDVIADDGYVRALFPACERSTIAGATVTVRAPRTVEGLVKIQTRGRLGCFYLHRHFPGLPVLERKRPSRIALFTARRPGLWLSLPVYFLVNLWGRWRASAQLRAGIRTWERDDSSRIELPDRGKCHVRTRRIR